MSGETDNLVLEHLQVIRSDQARMADRMSTMTAELAAIRHMLASVVTLQDHDHSDMAVVKGRLDRVEKRLDLVD